jgi:hypothetical protein
MGEALRDYELFPPEPLRCLLKWPSTASNAEAFCSVIQSAQLTAVSHICSDNGLCICCTSPPPPSLLTLVGLSTEIHFQSTPWNAQLLKQHLEISLRKGLSMLGWVRVDPYRHPSRYYFVGHLKCLTLLCEAILPSCVVIVESSMDSENCSAGRGYYFNLKVLSPKLFKLKRGEIHPRARLLEVPPALAMSWKSKQFWMQNAWRIARQSKSFVNVSLLFSATLWNHILQTSNKLSYPFGDVAGSPLRVKRPDSCK